MLLVPSTQYNGPLRVRCVPEFQGNCLPPPPLLSPAHHTLHARLQSSGGAMEDPILTSTNQSLRVVRCRAARVCTPCGRRYLRR